MLFDAKIKVFWGEREKQFLDCDIKSWPPNHKQLVVYCGHMAIKYDCISVYRTMLSKKLLCIKNVKYCFTTYLYIVIPVTLLVLTQTKVSKFPALRYDNKPLFIAIPPVQE